MTCHELEALRLALMNVLGTADEAARKHAEQELEGERDGAIGALADAGDLDAIRRHLDAALVALEEEIATTDESDPAYDYLRGRLVAVRSAEGAVARLVDQGESLFDDLGDSHDVLHEAFPTDE